MILCDGCGSEIHSPGAALLFGPPVTVALGVRVRKLHLCVSCYGLGLSALGLK